MRCKFDRAQWYKRFTFTLLHFRAVFNLSDGNINGLKDVFNIKARSMLPCVLISIICDFHTFRSSMVEKCSVKLPRETLELMPCGVLPYSAEGSYYIYRTSNFRFFPNQFDSKNSFVICIYITLQVETQGCYLCSHTLSCRP